MLQGSKCLGKSVMSKLQWYLAEPSDRLESARIIFQLLKHAKNVQSNELHCFPTSTVFRKSLKNSIESSSQVGGFYIYWDFEPTL